MSELVQIFKQLWRFAVGIPIALIVVSVGLAMWLTSAVRSDAAQAAGIADDRVEVGDQSIHLVGFGSESELDDAVKAVEDLGLGWDVSGELAAGREVASDADPGQEPEDSQSVTSVLERDVVETASSVPESTATTDTVDSSTDSSGQTESTTTTEANSTTTATEVVNSLNALFELEPINFEYLSSGLADESKLTLDAAAELINANPDAGRLMVVGHTDSLGPSNANQRLSERRAMVVVDYLVTFGAVDPERLEYEGRGESELKVDPQVSYWDGLANRRIEWEILS